MEPRNGGSTNFPAFRASPLPTTGRLLGIDIGEKRIGLALSDPTQTVAQPLATLTRRTGRRFPMRRLKGHLDQNQPIGIVVGLPLTPAGCEGDRARDARSTGDLISAKSGLPLDYWDERLTTARALEAVKTLGGKTRGRRGIVDQLAATVLLQTFLDSRRT